MLNTFSHILVIWLLLVLSNFKLNLILNWKVLVFYFCTFPQKALFQFAKYKRNNILSLNSLWSWTPDHFTKTHWHYRLTKAFPFLLCALAKWKLCLDWNTAVTFSSSFIRKFNSAFNKRKLISVTLFIRYASFGLLVLY